MSANEISITYIIGNGPNAVRIPLLAFPTPEQAVEYLEGLSITREEGVDYYQYVQVGKKKVEITEILLTNTKKAKAIRRGLFREGIYYGGCGEIYSLSVVTSPVGTPVVFWDLD